MTESDKITLRIEWLTPYGWRVRQEGPVLRSEATLERVQEHLRLCAIQYQHRAYIDGELVAEIFPPRCR